MSNPTASLDALPTLFHGDIPIKAPPGCVRPFPPGKRRWTGYRETLLFIRNETSPTTLVANVLNSYPYETINGPTGRLSPFLAESGICWMTQIDLDLDAEFAEALAGSLDSVVVWTPSRFNENLRTPLRRVEAVIHQYYEPAAVFGIYEIWRRKPGERDGTARTMRVAPGRCRWWVHMARASTMQTLIATAHRQVRHHENPTTPRSGFERGSPVGARRPTARGVLVEILKVSLYGRLVARDGRQVARSDA